MLATGENQSTCRKVTIRGRLSHQGHRQKNSPFALPLDVERPNEFSVWHNIVSRTLFECLERGALGYYQETFAYNWASGLMDWLRFNIVI